MKETKQSSFTETVRASVTKGALEAMKKAAADEGLTVHMWARTVLVRACGYKESESVKKTVSIPVPKF